MKCRLMTDHEMYRYARDAGWSIERQRKMKGMIVSLTSDEHPGKVAAAFGSAQGLDQTGELQAWERLAQSWDDDEDEFWFTDD